MIIKISLDQTRLIKLYRKVGLIQAVSRIESGESRIIPAKKRLFYLFGNREEDKLDENEKNTLNEVNELGMKKEIESGEVNGNFIYVDHDIQAKSPFYASGFNLIKTDWDLGQMRYVKDSASISTLYHSNNFGQEDSDYGYQAGFGGDYNDETAFLYDSPKVNKRNGSVVD